MIEQIESIVLNKAKKEAEEIISGALLGASEIIEKAKEKIPIIIDEYLKKAKSYINSQRQKIIGNVQLEINSQLIDIQNEILNKIFENLEDEIVKLLKDKNIYENYLKRIIDEVFKNNSFQNPVVYVNPNDFEIIKKFLNNFQIVKDENVKFGIIVEDKERGFIVRNTLKTRIEKVKQIVMEKFSQYIQSYSQQQD
ncbi:MAG: V-type ATP synthase subunit E [Candidatus Hydrothermia bacterium]|jgi:vacuolar-type H+-ATPase subunit E/Vma4|nr:V-type ATP synthase subunit E [Candidatus Hydrothermia bacterium]